ncbi:hypothetical protein N9C22_06740, partial [Paracoccaceae bacterium]|nr:hypothetical protein [Paracoccaceae bacterium]
MGKQAKDEKARLNLDLIESSFIKMQRGLEDENFFEVICISQSIINERLGTLLQNFQGVDDKLKLMTGLEETISNLLSYSEHHNIEINPEFRELLSDISAGQKGNTWVNRRDTSLHEYVSVFNDNIKFTAQMRDSFNRRTAELGVKLAIKTVRLTAKLQSSRADNLKR